MTRSQILLKGLVACGPPTMLVAVALTDLSPAWIGPAAVSVLAAIVADVALPEGPSVAWMAAVCLVVEVALIVAGVAVLRSGGAL